MAQQQGSRSQSGSGEILSEPYVLYGTKRYHMQHHITCNVPALLSPMQLATTRKTKTNVDMCSRMVTPQATVWSPVQDSCVREW